MRKIYYGIISYHRPECKSLKTLLEIGVPKDRILVSVNDERDYVEYSKRYNPEGINVVFKYGTNAAGNRNNVLSYFKNDAVVILDDDVIAVKKLIDDGSKYGHLRRLNYEKLNEEVQKCFEETEKYDALFGLYQIPNTGFMRDAILRDGLFSINKLFQGGFFGFLPNGKRFNNKFGMVEDYELLLREIKKGGYVLRRNDMCVIKEENGATKGGFFDRYKIGEEKIWLSRLKRRYPEMIQLKKDLSGVILKKGWWTV